MRVITFAAFVLLFTAPAGAAGRSVTLFLDGARIEQEVAVVKGYAEISLPAAMQANSLRIRPVAGGEITRVEVVALSAAGKESDSSDFRTTLPRFTPEARKANQALVDLLGHIAAQKKATPAQVALAWLLAQKPWIVPIPGTTKLNRLDENNGAASIELTADDLREIDSAAAQITVEGARYPEKLEQLTGR